jgi:tRNA dimethylallyltransferase
LVAIVGPTAVGKTRLSLALAEEFGGEIINADSRQVYKGMDVGTAKATVEERSKVIHHLLDIRNPDEPFNLAHFLDLANKSISDVQHRGQIPILVGGSGQYLWGLLEGWDVPTVPPNDALRADLELQAERRGTWVLHQLLTAIDPDVAAKVDAKNTRRVIRALEIHFAGRAKKNTRKTKSPRDDRLLVIGLMVDRSELYHRIDDRVDLMIRQGFKEEVQTLIEEGFSMSLPCMSGVGYQELAMHIKGEIELDEAIQRIKYRTHRIARHQNAWFRRDDTRIRWLKSDGSEIQEGKALLQKHLTCCDKIESLDKG